MPGNKCSVVGCDKPAKRSLSPNEYGSAVKDAELKVDYKKRMYFCEDHYKVVRKHARKKKKLDKWRFGPF